MSHIPFLEPVLPAPGIVAQEYAAIYERHIYSNSGPVERHLASAMKSWISDTAEMSLVSSATIGIQLAIKACCSPKKRLVLVPSFTFAAGPLCIRWCGFEPVLLDISVVDWQPSLDDARNVLEVHQDEVAGILLCNTFGTANDRISDWEALAGEAGVPLIIDSAAGFGSRYPWGEALGARGTCEIFSLHATKTFAIGEGGAVSTRDPDLAERIGRLKNFGFDASGESKEMGTNGKLSELSAAIGLRQLEQLQKQISWRQRVLTSYRQHLEPLGCTFQPNSQHSALAFVSTCLPRSCDRPEVLRVFQHRNIEVRTYYNPPIHRQEQFADSLCAGPLSETAEIADHIVSLPTSTKMTEDDVARVTAVILDCLT